MITRETIDKIHSLLDNGLVCGLGTPEPGKMCVEAAINYALGRPHGDDPGCVIQPLRRLKIKLNDSSWWTSNKSRAEGLRRLAIAQLGSLGVVDPVEFSQKVARMTVQTVVPGALRAIAARLQGTHPARLLAIALKCEQEPTKENALDAKSAAAYAAATAAYDAAAYDAATAAAYDAAAYDAAAYDAATAAAYDAAAYGAAAAAYDAAAYGAAAYDAATAAGEQVLSTFAENVVQILIEMKSPGAAWL
jgi:hypothetical protein